MKKYPIISGTQEDLITDYWKSKSKTKLKTLEEIFAEYCEENPGALECRQYDI